MFIELSRLDLEQKLSFEKPFAKILMEPHHMNCNIFMHRVLKARSRTKVIICSVKKQRTSESSYTLHNKSLARVHLTSHTLSKSLFKDREIFQKGISVY